MFSDLSREKLIDFFAETMHTILNYEISMQDSRPPDVSFREMRVVETVAYAAEGGKAARATEISSLLGVTPGTFTSAVDILEKKGYLTRTRDPADKRSVRVALTDKGVQAQKLHRDFLSALADELLENSSSRDEQALAGATDTLKAFYANKRASQKSAKVKILTDSTCDIPPEEAERLGIIVMPMGVHFGNETYLQDVDLTAADFFTKLVSTGIPPSTFQLTPHDIGLSYRKAAADGSEIVAIHLSSAISGTYRSAVLAAREVPGVYPVDSQNATAGIALLVRIAAELRDAGESAKSIAEKLTELSDRVLLLAYVPTLEYLVRGGRISYATGATDGVSDKYPVISIRSGIVKHAARAGGKKAAMAEIARIMDVQEVDERYGFAFMHAAATDDMRDLQRHLERRVGSYASMDCEIGAVIGSHSGPGAVGLAFITKSK